MTQSRTELKNLGLLVVAKLAFLEIIYNFDASSIETSLGAI